MINSNVNHSSNLNNKVSKNSPRAILGSVLDQDSSGLRVEALHEPLSAGLVYPVPSSRPQQVENEHQAVAVHDGCGDALVDGAWRGLSGQAVMVSAELQPVGKVLSPDELHDVNELLVAAALLLLLQLQHEEEADLHDHPVHSAQQIDVRGQEHNVLPWLSAAVRYSRI